VCHENARIEKLELHEFHALVRITSLFLQTVEDYPMARLHLAVGMVCALVCQSASAQTPAAQIKKTATPPVIDGNGSDAVWANANAYGTTTFFNVVDPPDPTPLQPSADFTIEWRALWDDTNLYVMSKVNDDVIVNSLEATGGPDTSANEHDDSIEFYIDAQDVNNTDYTGAAGLDQPTFQFTSIAGWTPAIANDATLLREDGVTPVSPRSLRDPPSLPNTSFTYGINSYGENDANTRYPQTMGSATSGPITENPAGGFDWTFEASFPWEALEETPADILARNGIFGFGVQYNDDDDRGDRDNYYQWEHMVNDMWQMSAAFPDAQLVDTAPTLEGDYNSDGSVDAADFVAWRDNPAGFGGDPAGYNTWRTNFGSTGGAGGGIGAGGVPEPATLVLLLLVTSLWVISQLRLRG
jgi:hypothetical protein